MSSYKGVVKVYFRDKGYGFIESEGLGNVFFHVSQIGTENGREIAINDSVSFVAENSRKKPGTYTAKNIRIN
jgi:cold shock CspA family protein